MGEGFFKWLRKFSNKIIHSIAFFPALIGIGFLLLSMLAMQMDAMGVGDQLNKQFKWLTLEDAETARTIVATVAGSIISLMVFSFSMVMIVMNQAASQMSNRMLDYIIGERFQKLVLGFYIGTIVYALFLSINIREADKEIKVPSLSVYLLLMFTVANIFLFVYFLHHITQTFRYEQLIKRIHNRTRITLIRWTDTSPRKKLVAPEPDGKEVLAVESGYFQGFSLTRLMKLAKEQDLVIRFLHTEGSYILKGTPFLILSGSEVDDQCIRNIFLNIDFYYGQEVDRNPYYGFQHLTEVGMKALSPAINDPGTAVLSLHALTDLLAYKIQNTITEVISDDKGNPRIITKDIPFDKLFDNSVMPIWDYGKNDRLIQKAALGLLDQLSFVDNEDKYSNLFKSLKEEVKSYQKI